MNRIFIAVTVTAVFAAGCPNSETPELTSIDGLKGGTLTSDVEVDGVLSATTLSAPSIISAEIDVTRVLATTVTAATATFSEGVTTPLVTATTGDIDGLSVETLTSTQMPRVGAAATAKALFPAIVGVAPRLNQAGLAAAEQSCSTVFASSHVCEETELRTALRFFDGDVATLNNTAVHASNPRAVGLVDLAGDSGNPPDVIPLVVDDCDNWTALPSNAGGIVQNEQGRPLTAVDLATTRFAHARVKLVVAGDRVLSDYDTECIATAVNFVCCE